ncbi:MAG: DUF3039 domain-containing protein [Microthrixaceae bacterium]
MTRTETTSVVELPTTTDTTDFIGPSQASASATVSADAAASASSTIANSAGPSASNLMEPTVLEPSGATTTITEERTETEDGPVAHIVKTKRNEDAAANVLAARVEGTPLEALCGHVWVPSRDPKQLPVCEKCKEIYSLYKDFSDGLDDTPRM